jgi:hypothetical protein
MPDLARPGAGGGRRIEHAAPVQLDRGEDLRAEQLRAAAVMRQRHQRIGGVEIPLEAAVIGLERPERQQDPRRHAVVAPRALEQSRWLLAHALAAVSRSWLISWRENR